ncbi:MAG: UvrD-helicase domain-containing protein [Clostridia bacterium]|nr:UvrD-helicase domain-containing protein [Clostridia bacterium]
MNENRTIKNKYETQQNRIQDLQKQLTSAAIAAADSDKQISFLKRTISEKEQRIEQVEKLVSESKSIILVKKQELESATQQLFVLQSQIIAIQADRDRINEELTNANQKLKERETTQKTRPVPEVIASNLSSVSCNESDDEIQHSESLPEIPSYLQKLNEEQIDAVKTTEGYVRVIAGAGSGKTRALTNRYVYLVAELGVSPASILCVTFTNKAANEMKKRIRQMIGDNDLSLICTFHSFCVQVLKVDAPRINYPRNFMVLDEEDTESILKKVYKEKGLTSNEYTFKEAGNEIKRFKGLNMELYIGLLTNPDPTPLSKRYEEASTPLEEIIWGYIYEQRKNFGFDFDDLILTTFYIFEHYPDILEKWQKKLEYIMVDEFQDVSKRQFGLCYMLQEYHKNLFVVGDPDQTIYSFRGADISIILNFDKTFPGTKTIMMTKNYRSSPNIIDVSNNLIEHNASRIKKDLIPIKTQDVQTIYNHAKSSVEEAEWIAETIVKLNKVGVELNSFAILYRAHYVSRPIEESLMKRKISYTIYSGISFYERKEIKDVLSYLRMLIYQDDLSFLRTVNEPRRNIGETRINRLKEYAKAVGCTLYQALQQLLDQGDPLFIRGKGADYVSLIEKYRNIYQQYTLTDLLEAIMRESGYEEMMQTQGEDERLENIAELRQSMVDYEDSSQEDFGLEDYLSKIALFTNIDKEEKGKTVRLMTVHSAKGLEFPYVFVCGLSEGIFPSSKTDTVEKLEEERRLAYVAFTRAETALFLSDAEGYNYNLSYRYPSRFIFNINKNLLIYTKELEESLVSNAVSQIQQNEHRIQQKENLPTIHVGTTIVHPLFKTGKVISIDETNGIYEVEFYNGQVRHLTKNGLSNCRIVDISEEE